ncbi:branched chain amino acid aminotransferase, partial [Candidatus Bipolaricaulota bacterium]|nr:branched chain amino acid aminotransferase [Candidatus Bipolaricaulota bacterium]
VMTLASEQGFDVEGAAVPRDMLYLADEIFFTGTAAEISPIVEVDGHQVGTGRPGPITQSLAEAFFDIVKGRAADRHGWLTHP